MLRTLIAFAIGTGFGVGLLLAGMSNPAKIINFFDIFGTWDPSLAFTFGGALGAAALGYRTVLRMKQPLLGGDFHIPARTAIDVRLIGGAGLFGIGFGMIGVCPGGLIPALGLGRTEPFIAAAGILLGILCYRMLMHPPNWTKAQETAP